MERLRLSRSSRCCGRRCTKNEASSMRTLGFPPSVWPRQGSTAKPRRNERSRCDAIVVSYNVHREFNTQHRFRIHRHTARSSSAAVLHTLVVRVASSCTALWIRSAPRKWCSPQQPACSGLTITEISSCKGARSYKIAELRPSGHLNEQHVFPSPIRWNPAWTGHRF